ncbi:LacI family transcriptional regulator [Opitutaceae bacterium TAV4]|nr:LacI family transcriptional regulator [Opitutaceae bacterium TAV4]RRK01010.1 LacI family transcriptional regulator [Opitutaceae bacterium TAV3]
MVRVAEAAGVSQMTVSRSLRNDPSIPSATRQRIKRIAAQLGYRPDPMVSQLMARLRQSRVSKTAEETVAWITTHPTATGWRNNPASVAFHAGATARARELGYRIEEFWFTAPGMNGHRLSEILRARGIRGVLVAPLVNAELVIDLGWSSFAAASCAALALPSVRLHRACAHYVNAIHVAWRELARLGYKRIGLALPTDNHKRVAGLWLAGALLEQRGLPARQVVPPLVTDDWRPETVLAWMRKQRPDVVLSFRQVCDWLQAGGVRVPEDCGFALLHIEDPLFAGVDEHRPDIGAAALDLVVEQINANQLGLPAKPKTVFVECSWVDGRTAPGPNEIRS